MFIITNEIINNIDRTLERILFIISLIVLKAYIIIKNPKNQYNYGVLSSTQFN
jgi:hypothetical protein